MHRFDVMNLALDNITGTKGSKQYFLSNISNDQNELHHKSISFNKVFVEQ